jgi:1-hydroxycarotenoid 3,4-desaturase
MNPLVNGSDATIVVGAGVGGLVAALDLARQGIPVTLVDRAPRVGGKMATVTVDGLPIDTGPTIVTMRWVFESLFADAHVRMEDHLQLERATILARHVWPDGSRLDLFADPERSVRSIADLAGPAEGDAYARFIAHARRIYQAVEAPFIRSGKPTLLGLVRQMGWQGARTPLIVDVHRTMWQALSSYFRDPRLRQLFGRYATYQGSSPFRAPGTLNLIADVEQQGVFLPVGGVYAVAAALERLLRAQGATIRLGEGVSDLLTDASGIRGVRLESGEELPARHVVYNGDTAALAAGLLGRPAAAVAPRRRIADRSLSAVTWYLRARTSGFPLLRHTVFFSDDYPAEFRSLTGPRQLPASPTIYVCADDRGGEDAPLEGPDRLYILANAASRGDVAPYSADEVARCEERAFRRLEAAGLKLEPTGPAIRRTPNELAALYPATGGAIYGPANHGLLGSFRRPGSRTRLPGLYLSGGSAHPGPGVPMTAISGRLAAAALMEDRCSTRR